MIVAQTAEVRENCCSKMVARIMPAVRKELNEIENYMFNKEIAIIIWGQNYLNLLLPVAGH